ncbi:hypothetical protein BDV25DRAFT_153996 [Aspergillus avenaceus]|uniref:Uncharacterized protein n=1 Tax=Aspergillus avenaceus TaxID=36643 RepID=A0A5N6TX91_ASPAV|nr:hypothetical protein BDV25DRAFT_153996 [Aspergillus avenaceus]
MSSHIRMLNMVQKGVTRDDATFNLVSTMIEKTNRMITQFGVLKKQLQESSGNDWRRKSRSTDSRKRSRVESMDVESDVPVGAVQKPKRQRSDMLVPGHDEDVRNVTPVALETEDISEEVQRRLEIKEEKRQKREPKPRKRTRDSMESAGSPSSAGMTTMSRKKRVKPATSRTSLDGLRSQKNPGSFASEPGDQEQMGRPKRQKRLSGAS